MAESEFKMPVLSFYECGCVSGHDSLIRLWVPQDFTADDIAHVEALWALMMKQFHRSIEERTARELPSDMQEAERG